jgi:hypothetical protein
VATYPSEGVEGAQDLPGQCRLLPTWPAQGRETGKVSVETAQAQEPSPGALSSSETCLFVGRGNLVACRGFFSLSAVIASRRPSS